MPLCKNSYSVVYSKQIPPSIRWSSQIRYTFPLQDNTHIYKLPYSSTTFWVNFRLGKFYKNGNSKTDLIRARLYVITADGCEFEIISWNYYRPCRWYSTRWPIPSLPHSNQGGVFLELDTAEDSPSLYRIELQGFDSIYQLSENYILIDEEDRHYYLFKYEKNLEKYRINGGNIGSIHAIYDYDLLPTHGIDNNEIDGVPLFPLGSRQEYVYHFHSDQ